MTAPEVVVKKFPVGIKGFQYKIYWKECWLTLRQFSQVPECRKIGLTPENLYHRVIKKQSKTFEEIFNPRIEAKTYKDDDSEEFYGHGVDPDIWEAMKTGSNKALLEAFKRKEQRERTV